ncbi:MULTISPECIES: AtaL-like protein [unclassified Iodidimonas]|jgi:hypothetical protein|uniref:AtaL-like protein n=1 Tax=unclassified Iodidimonas TaxID=2626145 RepID=UPI00248290EB|nr:MULTISPECIES: AtaL-like protein [unclassified Iodidimonas]
MPFTNFKTDVHASADLLWDMMVEKIRRPDKFVPGVVSVEILQEFSDLSVERRMTVKDGNNSKIIREIITADPVTRTVIFKLKDDQAYTGYVLNMVFDEDGKVELDYTMHWTPKNPDTQINEPNWESAIHNAVLHAKKLAEAEAG